MKKLKLDIFQQDFIIVQHFIICMTYSNIMIRKFEIYAFNYGKEDYWTKKSKNILQFL